ncbi:MAG: hypothetical protein Q9190_006122 [Brigantiaea leucoxantha]
MLVSIVSPEYILGKALTENIAAHYSQKAFNHKGWSATHAYFADMRGFVMRFKVAAAVTDLEPRDPDKKDDGRALWRPTPHGDPPYYPQDAREAQRRERQHCESKNKRKCQHRLDDALPEKNAPLSSPSLGQMSPALGAQSPLLSPREDPSKSSTLSAKRHGWERLRVKTGIDFKIEPKGQGAHKTPKSPAVPPSPLSADFLTVHTPSTLVNGRDFAQTLDTVEDEKSQPKSPVESEVEPEFGRPHSVWQGNWPLSSLQMLYAYQNGIISQPPEVTAEDLSDRSKADVFVKAAAVGQLVWLIVQIITRTAEGMATSSLEITVLALAACSIVTYSLYWHKPQDIQVPIYFDAARLITREDVIQLAARSPVSTLVVRQFWLHGVAIREVSDIVFPWTPGLLIRFPGMKTPTKVNPVFIGIGGGGALFGAVHFAAWCFHFPSVVERDLWRISCVVLLLFPVLGTLTYCLTQRFAKDSDTADSKTARILKPVSYTFVLIYLLARCYVLVEVFRSLAYSPLSTFDEVNWPSMIPHAG